MQTSGFLQVVPFLRWRRESRGRSELRGGERRVPRRFRVNKFAGAE